MPLSPCHLSLNLPLLCRMLLNIFYVSVSPPTIFGALVAPSCQFLSGQLTGCCRAFPATRATGKRPSAALFDVPSPLILYTWAVLGTDFFSFSCSFYLFFLPTLFLTQFLNFFLVAYCYSISFMTSAGIPQSYSGCVIIMSFYLSKLSIKNKAHYSSTQILL